MLRRIVIFLCLLGVLIEAHAPSSGMALWIYIGLAAAIVCVTSIQQTRSDDTPKWIKNMVDQPENGEKIRKEQKNGTSASGRMMLGCLHCWGAAIAVVSVLLVGTTVYGTLPHLAHVIAPTSNIVWQLSPGPAASNSFVQKTRAGNSLSSVSGNRAWAGSRARATR